MSNGETARQIWDSALASRRARTKAMPTTDAALSVMFEAYMRLMDLGFSPIQYCPKDGTVFESVSIGSTGIADTMYQGEWPDGSWWVMEAGDLWPARPILYREKKGKTMTDRVESTSDERTTNNTMRHQYRVLSDDEKAQMQNLKDQGLAFIEACDAIGSSRELSLAKTKMEEAVMWAVKHVTA